MSIQLVNKNIVLLGEFIPSSFDKHFFIKNKIFKESDDFKNSVFVPELSIIETSNYFIEVTLNRIAIEIKNSENQVFDTTELVKQSKVYAIGFNFKWFLPIKDFKKTKEFFWFKENKLNSFFNENESNYGYYVSKNFEGSRMKLDIKPLQAKKSDDDDFKNFLNFDFNFHIEQKEFNSEFMVKKLCDFEKEAYKIVLMYDEK